MQSEIDKLKRKLAVATQALELLTKNTWEPYETNSFAIETLSKIKKVK
jgi:hypothetical protein